jgi:hypothetical protein
LRSGYSVEGIRGDVIHGIYELSDIITNAKCIYGPSGTNMINSSKEQDRIGKI